MRAPSLLAFLRAGERLTRPILPSASPQVEINPAGHLSFTQARSMRLDETGRALKIERLMYFCCLNAVMDRKGAFLELTCTTYEVLKQRDQISWVTGPSSMSGSNDKALCSPPRRSPFIPRHSPDSSSPNTHPFHPWPSLHPAPGGICMYLVPCTPLHIQSIHMDTIHFQYLVEGVPFAISTPTPRATPRRRKQPPLTCPTSGLWEGTELASHSSASPTGTQGAAGPTLRVLIFGGDGEPRRQGGRWAPRASCRLPNGSSGLPRRPPTCRPPKWERSGRAGLRVRREYNVFMPIINKKERRGAPFHPTNQTLFSCTSTTVPYFVSCRLL